MSGHPGNSLLSSIVQELMDQSKKEDYIIGRIIKQLDLLLSTDCDDSKLDQEIIFDCAIRCGHLMRENGKFFDCLNLIRWVVRSCHLLLDSSKRLKIIKRCGRAIWSVGIATKRRKQDYGSEIIKYAIPTLKSLLDLIDKIGMKDVRELGEAHAWCSYYTAACHQYSKKYSQVYFYSNLSISLMKDTFGSDYKKHRVVGLSHAICGEAWSAMKSYPYAIEEYVKASEVFECAEDIGSEMYRKSCVNHEKKKITMLRQSYFFKSLRSSDQRERFRAKIKEEKEETTPNTVEARV